MQELELTEESAKAKEEMTRNGFDTSKSLSDQMIQKAFTTYMQMEARKASIKAPHKDKVKKKRRAKNKVARQSRKR